VRIPGHVNKDSGDVNNPTRDERGGLEPRVGIDISGSLSNKRRWTTGLSLLGHSVSSSSPEEKSQVWLAFHELLRAAGPGWISTVLAVERASSCSPTSGQGNAVSFYGRG
jgi:hypothetical protein